MGTDAGTPFNFHGENAQELERMVAFGMSPMQAILASTSAAARLIGIQDQVGTIEKGKLADLLLFEGNPLRRIDLLRDRSTDYRSDASGQVCRGTTCPRRETFNVELNEEDGSRQSYTFTFNVSRLTVFRRTTPARLRSPSSVLCGTPPQALHVAI